MVKSEHDWCSLVTMSPRIGGEERTEALVLSRRGRSLFFTKVAQNLFKLRKRDIKDAFLRSHIQTNAGHAWKSPCSVMKTHWCSSDCTQTDSEEARQLSKRAKMSEEIQSLKWLDRVYRRGAAEKHLVAKAHENPREQKQRLRGAVEKLFSAMFTFGEAQQDDVRNARCEQCGAEVVG